MTFFCDNCIPPVIVKLLELLRVTAVHLSVEFATNTKDEVWLSAIAERGWVLITADDGIRTRPAQRDALTQSRIITFFLPGSFASSGRWEQVRWIAVYWERIEKAARKAKPGDLFRITHRNGTITPLD